jgi:integron integrase
MARGDISTRFQFPEWEPALLQSGLPTHRQESMGIMCRVIRIRKYAYRTEQSYVEWLTRFARFVRGNDLAQYGAGEVRSFLDDLAVRGKVSASTQRQALNALGFYYREVLERDLGDFSDYRRATGRTHLRTSMTQAECEKFLAAVEPPMKLLIGVLYGSGLRLMECLRLRVQDLDLERHTLIVRAGKGDKDRVTVLAECLIEPLRQHLKFIRGVWEEDRRQGLAGVWLPEALARKYPKAGEQWTWFWLWPSRETSEDPRSGIVRRHHVLDKRVQQAVRGAAHRAGLTKRITLHVLRHTFATLLLEQHTDVRTLQELLGHRSLETTQVYLHVMNRPGLGVRSPLDG